MSKFRTGQRWHYKTRPGEESSWVLIGKIDEAQSDTPIIHVHIAECQIQNPFNPEGFQRTFSFAPLGVAAFEGSITSLIDENYPIPAEFDEDYVSWRAEYDAGGAGVWNVSVAEVIALVEKAVLETAEEEKQKK